MNKNLHKLLHQLNQMHLRRMSEDKLIDPEVRIACQ